MTVRAITVDNRVCIPISCLSSAELARIESEFTYDNPDYAKWKQLKLRSRPPPSRLITWNKVPNRLSRDGFPTGPCVTVPRGGLERVKEILGDSLIVVWNTTRGTVNNRPIPEHQVELWGFQESMVEHAIANEVCCLRAPPAAGKTTAALALAARLNLYTLVIVWTGALLKQWIERCGSELGLFGDDIGIIQGSERRIRPITIGMQQTLGNCIEEYADQFGVVICDELQRFASETFNAVIDKCPAKYRIGVSADERRADGKEFLIYDMFGEVAFEVERQELEDAGRIIDVEVRVVPTDFDREWYRSLVKRSRFGSKQQLAMAFNRLLEEMTNDATRNELIAGIAAEHVAAGQLVVALSHRREHCGVLSAEFDRVTGGKGGILLGGKGNEAEYARAKEGLKTGRVRAGAATYQAFGTGMDIPGLEVGLFTTPVGNSKKAKMQFDQYRGRFARAAAGKSSACVYYIWDRHLYGDKPIKNLVSWCKHVVVRHDGQWVPAREFVKERRHAQAKRDSSTDEAPGLFFDPRKAGAAPVRKLRSRSSIRS